MSTHKHSTPILITVASGEIEIPVEITFSFTSGAPDTRDEQGYGAEVEIMSASMTLTRPGTPFAADIVTQVAAPDWLVDIMAADDTLREELIMAAADERDGPDPDDARDQRLEDAFLDRHFGAGDEA